MFSQLSNASLRFIDTTSDFDNARESSATVLVCHPTAMKQSVLLPIFLRASERL